MKVTMENIYIDIYDKIAIYTKLKNITPNSYQISMPVAQTDQSVDCLNLSESNELDQAFCGSINKLYDVIFDRISRL